MNELDQLLYLRRVAAEYFDYSGQRIEVPYELRLKYLQAVGYNTDDAGAVRQAIFELDAAPWKSWLKPFSIITQGEPAHFEIRLAADEVDAGYSWQLITESGEQHTGALVPADLEEVGNYVIDGVRYSARRQPLPDLPAGYHRLTVSSAQARAVATLAVAPWHCYERSDEQKSSYDSIYETGAAGHGDQAGVYGQEDLPAATGLKPLLGISCQIYTLRSTRNWGIGDFSDLQELVAYCAAQRMDFIGLNPLHAPNFSGVDFASPYSPSDRRFLNPLYIDAQRVAEYSSSKSIATLVKSSGFQRKLNTLRAASYIDYEGVVALKYWAFEELFRVFSRQHLAANSSRAQAFNEFVQRGGVALQKFAEYETRHGIGTIKAASAPLFHQYLQWLASEQLQQCQASALAAGMRIGLLGDLAVGAGQGGAEVADKPNLFCLKASIGAPPDPFSSEGQDWSLPALDPIELERDDFAHYIDLLRANMAHCGALRIDHVMGLMRLWWCLPGIRGGAYVYYPLETLLAILRLESHRNQCMVIGEDMGVVPAEMRTRMAQTTIYSNKLFYFERDHQGHFKQPADYPRNALLMVTSHDVPTLAGWWNGSELALRADIGLIDEQHELPRLLDELRVDKHRLLDWLQTQQLLPPGWQAESFDGLVARPFDLALCEAVLRGCARSRSRLVSLQLEDLQLIEEPVNIPGTFKEHPNWRRKQLRATSAIFQNPQVLAVLDSTYEARNQ